MRGARRTTDCRKAAQDASNRTKGGKVAPERGTGPILDRFLLMADKVHDTPSDVTAEDGEVMVDGPGGVAVSLTPDAASETSERLLYGAATAQGQRVAERDKRKPLTR